MSKKEKGLANAKPLFYMVSVAGFEPATPDTP